MNGRPYVVVVTGSRHWKDPTLVRRALTDRLNQHGAIVVVHGAANGVDQIAHQWVIDATVAGWWEASTQPYPADWKANGKAAGPIRNRKMLEEGQPDEVLAFPSADSRGTYGCIHEARRRNIPTTICDAEGIEWQWQPLGLARGHMLGAWDVSPSGIIAYEDIPLPGYAEHAVSHHAPAVRTADCGDHVQVPEFDDPEPYWLPPGEPDSIDRTMHILTFHRSQCLIAFDTIALTWDVWTDQHGRMIASHNIKEYETHA